jgi:Zn-dependent M16 (insulinase) family peptidase
VLARLEAIRTHIAHRGCLDVFVAASGYDAVGLAVDALSDELEAIADGGTRAGRLGEAATELTHDARTFGQPTAFNCELWRVPAGAHPDAAALLVAGSVISSLVRGDVVRGGTAYGAACDAFSDPGSLACWSIRDPNIVRTYDAFESAVAKVRAGDFDHEAFALAKFEASIASDMPESPPGTAFRAFVRNKAGFGPDAQVRFADTVASLTPDDVRDAAERHLSATSSRASLTSPEMAAQAGCFGAVREV